MIATTFDHRCRAGRRRASAVMVALVAFVPLACGEPKDASLCTAFKEFLDIRAEVAAIDAADLTITTAGEATEIAEDYLAGVRRLEQAADGRYGTAARHARDCGQRRAVHARIGAGRRRLLHMGPAGRGRSGIGRGRGRRGHEGHRAFMQI